MAPTPVRWPDHVDAIMTGDLTAAAAYITAAGGAVVTGVAPCGLVRRDDGVVGYTTSLAFGKKLERILRDPRVALAYHARDYGFSRDNGFVLVQGTATVDLTPSPARLEAFAPQVVRYLGELKRGPVWDRLLKEYYAGWLNVSSGGVAVYAPHTSKGFSAPPSKNLLLISNGLLAKLTVRQARRRDVLTKLERVAGS